MSIFDSTEENNIIVNRSSDCEAFTVMNQDIPLFRVSNGIVEHVCTENFIFLPYALKKEIITFADYYSWASRRALLISRSNAKKLLNALDIDQSDSYAIARSCRLLSLDDNFWIQENSEEKYSDFCLRKNSLDHAVCQLMLNGQHVTLSGEITTAELTNQGSFPKGWERRVDNVYLQKRSQGHFESEREVLVSDLLDCVDVQHVKYRLESPGICSCACMTNDEVYRLNYSEYRVYCKQHDLAPLSQIMRLYREDFQAMCIVDYLIANTDRHSGNWGFFVENSSNRIVGLHPLFDHNNSFDESFTDNYHSVIFPKYTMREVALEAQQERKLNLRPLLDFPRERFEEVMADYDNFRQRLELLVSITE